MLSSTNELGRFSQQNKTTFLYFALDYIYLFIVLFYLLIWFNNLMSQASFKGFSRIKMQNPNINSRFRFIYTALSLSNLNSVIICISSIQMILTKNKLLTIKRPLLILTLKSAKEEDFHFCKTCG